LLLGVGCVIAFLVLEGFLRFFDPLGQRIMGDQIVLPKNLELTMDNDLNPKLDSVIHFTTNSIGFRGKEPPENFEDHLTLVAIGGSTTECLFLSDGQSWPNVLGDVLSPAFDRLWVNNAGLDGHSTFGHVFLLEQIIVNLRPKVAMFLIGINDVGRERQTGREGPRQPPSLVLRLARHSMVVATALNLARYGEAESRELHHEQIDLVTIPKVEQTPALAQTLRVLHEGRYLELYAERVREIVETSRTNGIEPVLLTQPALYGPDVDPWTLVNLGSVHVSDERRIKGERVRGTLAWSILEMYNDVVRDIGREQDVLVIDVARELTKSSLLFYDWVHFTKEGARELANLAAVQLCPFLAERFPEHLSGTCPEDYPALGRASNADSQLLDIGGELDLGKEPAKPYALVGEGWFEPETETDSGVTFRSSRGRRSWLNVPFADATASNSSYDVVLRARSEMEGSVGVRLDINGVKVGSAEISEAWTEHRFQVPSDTLTRGLNTLTLFYSQTPRTVDSEFRGRNAAIAVDFVGWTQIESRP
jgi:lysophospholipase L1-like esterase